VTEREHVSAESAAPCVVLRNDEEQYAIWSADRRIPAGWRRIGGPESAAWCGSLVDRLWTDMRPASVRAGGRPPESWPSTVPELVRDRARREPSALAVLSDDVRLSSA
jgi:uncharacterized protein YbdZ (MbtH family)